MKILYIGDIVGEPGRDIVARLLPGVRAELEPDVIVAQSENVSHGSGITVNHVRELQRMGIDFFTGGNHSLKREALYGLLASPDEPIIRPANLPADAAGVQYKYLQTPAGAILFVSLLGYTAPRPVTIDNPLHCIDAILEKEYKTPKIATIINFHGDLSSEKRVIGYYLDGRVTAVIGDHWHVPTADAMVLPKGTAHITDVGMCGTLHSSLGVTLDLAIRRWHDDLKAHNKLEVSPPFQFNAVLIEIDPATGLSTAITQVQKLWDGLTES